MSGKVNKEIPLECGTGILEYFRSRQLSWEQILSEWLDNSFDANATRVVVRKTGTILEVIDNGDGCDDVGTMQSPAKKGAQRRAAKSSMYHLGGLMGQLNSSQGTITEVHSTTSEKISKIVCNWAACIEGDRLFAEHFEESKAPPKAKTGTKITIHNCRRIRDVPAIARMLGFRYRQLLLEKRSITLEINDEKIKVVPYALPKFQKEIPIDFMLDEHHITGHCWLVAPGEPNPYYGWSFLWAHRATDPYHEPADGRPDNRILAIINLPPTWRNIDPTKDRFKTDPDALWDALAEHCRPIIEAADSESNNVELSVASRILEDILCAAMGGNRKVKGARPGSSGKEGTVEPSGRGGEHKEFKVVQPGDKATDDSAIPSNTPASVHATFDDTIEYPYSINVSGYRSSRTFMITLNPKFERIGAFRDSPEHLATLCVGYIAQWIAQGDDSSQRYFPAFEGMHFRDIYRDLLLHGSTSEAVAKKPKRRRLAM